MTCPACDGQVKKVPPEPSIHRTKPLLPPAGAMQGPLLTELVKKGYLRGPDLGPEFGARRQSIDQCHSWSGDGMGTAGRNLRVKRRRKQ